MVANFVHFYHTSVKQMGDRQKNVTGRVTWVWTTSTKGKETIHNLKTYSISIVVRWGIHGKVTWIVC
jgi:hypothetical protein